MERLKSFLEQLEEWFIENDLHIYFGVLTIVVVSILGVMLYTEIEKNKDLRDANIVLNATLSEKERAISLLQSQAELNKIPSASLPVAQPPVAVTVEKISNRLNDKIEKVQNTLINNPIEPRIITKTQAQTIEKPLPVDTELKTMMKTSFCTSFPEDKICPKVKK